MYLTLSLTSIGKMISGSLAAATYCRNAGSYSVINQVVVSFFLQQADAIARRELQW